MPLRNVRSASPRRSSRWIRLSTGEEMTGVRDDSLRNLALEQILAAQQADESRMRGEMIEGEVEQLQQRLHGRHVVDLELQFLLPQLAENVFQYGDIEPGLVVEVVIHHADVRPRGGTDRVEPPAGEALVGELVERGEENALARPWFGDLLRIRSRPYRGSLCCRSCGAAMAGTGRWRGLRRQGGIHGSKGPGVDQ